MYTYTYTYIYIPVGSQPGRLYGLCKVHKDNVDESPPFRPILSAINTPTYHLAKFLIPYLEPITTNEFVVKDSFSFAENIRKLDKNAYMTSFDINSLFTNIPLNETIDICIKLLYPSKNKKVKGISRDEFRLLLEIATKESLFIFDNKCYSQLDGVAMGSPLGPTLANIFLCFHEKQWLKTCPKQFKPVCYQRYVDDIFCLFENESHINKFEKFINSKHKNITFTKELEKDSKLSFLDILITRTEEEFVTSVYRKPTFSGIYQNFKSHVPLVYKYGLIYSLLHRTYMICSNWQLIHEEINNLKGIWMQNKYPLGVINYCIRNFLNKLFIEKTDITTVPKKEFSIILPFMGNDTIFIKNRLNRFFQSEFPAFKLKFIIKSGRKMGSFFNFKDAIHTHLRSLVVYKYTCSSCNVTYLGKTKRHFKVRMCEHLGISHITGKPRKYNAKQTTAVKEHIRESGHQGEFKDFKIMCNAGTNFELLLKESLLIQKHNPVLNKQIKTFQLSLF